MAQIYGRAGSSSRSLARYRRNWNIALLIFCCIAFIGLIVGLIDAGQKIRHESTTMILLTVIIVGIPVLLFAIWQIRDIRKDYTDVKKRIRDAEEGAWAEEMINALLTKLPDSYAVFHDLPYPGGDIDHIVIGPTGLFVLDTKSHSGKVVITENSISLNNHPFEKDIVSQIHEGAKWLEETLLVEGGIEAKPMRMIVFTRAYVECKVKPPIKGIFLMNRSFMNRHILSRDITNLPIPRIVEILKKKVVIEQAETPAP